MDKELLKNKYVDAKTQIRKDIFQYLICKYQAVF